MAKNKFLVDKIRDPEFWAGMDEDKRKDLLESILTVDETDADAFKQAIITNAEQWGLEVDRPSVISYIFSTRGSINANDFLDPADNEYPFLKIKRAAAEQRFKLPLEEADKSLLLAIFAYNEDELRQYLEDKVPKLKDIPAWQNDPTNILTSDVKISVKKQAVALWVAKAVEEAEPQTLEVLDNAYYNNKHETEFPQAIQQQFPDLPQGVEQYIDEKLIWQLAGDNIAQGSKAHEQAKAALKVYKQYIEGMDEETLLMLGDDIANLPDNIGDKDKLTPENIKTLKEQLDARYVLKQAKDALDAYDQYIEGLDEETVLRLGDDIANFPANLPDDIGDKDKLTSENIEALREQLGARYWMPAIAKKLDKGENLASLFVQDTREKFIEKLGEHFPGHTYLDKVVTEPFMEEFKERMTSKMVSQLTAKYNLSTVFVKTKSDEQFKTALTELVTSASFATRLFPGIDKEDAIAQASTFVASILSTLDHDKIEVMRKSARINMLEIALFQVTGLVPGAHPTLVEEFSKLDVSAQHKLLPELGGDLNDIRHIVNTRDLNVLKHYMPSASEEALQRILASAKQRDILKGILNPGVYKALASRYPFGLTDTQVVNINDIVIGGGWDLPTNYANRVNEIWIECNSDNPNNVNNANEKTKFYRVFGLKADGTEIHDSRAKKIVSDIFKHNKKYDSLFDELVDTTSPINQKLLRKMLSFSLSPIGLLPNTSDGINSFNTLIQENMLRSHNREFFINVCVGNLKHYTPTVAEEDQAKFKASLEEAITPAVYNEMQGELVREALVDRNSDTANTAVQSVHNILDKMQETHIQIDAHIQKAGFVRDVKEIHINNALIREKETGLSSGVESTKDRYAKLAQECDVMMDQLRHDYARLQTLIDSIPETEGIKNSVTKTLVGPEIAALKKALNDQLDQITQQLKQYADIKDQITGTEKSILTMIDRVLAKPYWYYKREGLSTDVFARSDLSVRPIKRDAIAGRPESSPIIIDASSKDTDNVTDKVVHFTLGDALKKDEVHCFDLVNVRENTTDPTKTVTVESRFTYDTSKEVSATVQGRRVDKAHPGRIEVQKFPSYKEGSAEDADLLEQAKVDFAMVLATQLLATMDRPPSKENPLRVRGSNPEQLKYIWTAFVVLGENTPHMKFGPEAVRVVNTDAFDPKAERGWRGFSKNSLHETVFTKHMDRVNSAISDSKEHASERFDKKGTKSEAEMKETSNFYKSSLSSSKEQTENRIHQHGISAETPAEEERRAEEELRVEEEQRNSLASR